jgi:hypothetical protein
VPRFVILHHDWPTPHWDLLLEYGPVLKAWRLLAEPGAGRTVPAEANFDHRPLYLDCEGPLSGGRGRVTRWDAGTYEGGPDAAGEWTIRLAGGGVEGAARLSRTVGGWAFTIEPLSGGPRRHC